VHRVPVSLTADNSITAHTYKYLCPLVPHAVIHPTTDKQQAPGTKQQALKAVAKL